MNFLESLAMPIIKQRLKIPTADLQKVADDSAQYTSDGQPLTTDQIQAADSAIIDYVMGRIVSGQV